jgi:hypothetical protein
MRRSGLRSIFEGHSCELLPVRKQSWSIREWVMGFASGSTHPTCCDVEEAGYGFVYNPPTGCSPGWQRRERIDDGDAQRREMSEVARQDRKPVTLCRGGNDDVGESRSKAWPRASAIAARRFGCPRLSPFRRACIRCNYPEGLIVPIIYGLKGLMVVGDGEVRWAVRDPSDFVSRNLMRIAESYQLVMNMARWDPQKISKDPNSYEYAVREFQNALNDEQRGVRVA